MAEQNELPLEPQLRDLYVECLSGPCEQNAPKWSSLDPVTCKALLAEVAKQYYKLAYAVPLESQLRKSAFDALFVHTYGEDVYYRHQAVQALVRKGLVPRGYFSHVRSSLSTSFYPEGCNELTVELHAPYVGLYKSADGECLYRKALKPDDSAVRCVPALLDELDAAVEEYRESKKLAAYHATTQAVDAYLDPEAN